MVKKYQQSVSKVSVIKEPDIAYASSQEGSCVNNTKERNDIARAIS